MVDRKELPREFSFESGEKTDKVRKMVNSDKLSPFYKKTMKDVFMFSLSYGFSKEIRTPLKKKTGGAVVPTRVFNDLDISLMKCIAVASINNVDILLPEKKGEFVDTIEEYVNGGFNLLYFIIYGEVGDPVDLLEQEIRGYYEKNLISIESVESKVIDPRDYLSDFENDLRLFIRDKLMEVEEDNWWKIRISGNIKKEAKKRKESNENVEVGLNNHELLYYLDFAEYFEIIKQGNNWQDVFQKYFPSRNWLEVKLNSELRQIRNKIAHNRLLTIEDERKLIMIINELKKQMNLSFQ